MESAFELRRYFEHIFYAFFRALISFWLVLDRLLLLGNGLDTADIADITFSFFFSVATLYAVSYSIKSAIKATSFRFFTTL